MAKIIYKEGCEGENKLSSIEGIEIDLLNGQKALIYPKYAGRQMLASGPMSKWDAYKEAEIEALKVEDIDKRTAALFIIGSPAAEWVSHFWSDKYGLFYLPSLLAALEIRHQKQEIDALAKTIEGADLLKNFTSDISSCSRCDARTCWFVYGSGCTSSGCLDRTVLVVPTILYR